MTHFNVVLLDQRGTGKSSPVTAQSLAKLGGPENQTGYLQHFRLRAMHTRDSHAPSTANYAGLLSTHAIVLERRADNIVKDSEIIRSVLIGPDEQWSILGQSFGGFCCLRYLSTAPQSEQLTARILSTDTASRALDNPFFDAHSHFEPHLQASVRCS